MKAANGKSATDATPTRVILLNEPGKDCEVIFWGKKFSLLRPEQADRVQRLQFKVPALFV